MKFLWIGLTALLTAWAGLYYLAHHQPEVDQAKLVQAARDYIASQPVIETDSGLEPWDQFWQSKGFADLVPRSDWLINQPVLFNQVGRDQYQVRWLARPGCRLTEDLSLGAEARLVDEQGKKCQFYWEIVVDLNLKGQPQQVRVYGRGGEL